MKIIQIGKISFSFVYLLFLFSFQTGRNFIDLKIQIKNKQIDLHFILKVFVMFIGEIIGAIGCIGIIKCLEQKKRIKTITKTNILLDPMLMMNFIKNKRKKAIYTYFIIFGIAIIDCFTFCLFFIYFISETMEIFINSFHLLFMMIFTYFFLQYPIYRHHVFANFLIIFVTFVFFIYNEGFLKVNGINICIYSLCIICLSLKISLEKYLMKIHFYGPFILLLLEGCLGCILSLIVYYFIKIINNDQLNQVITLDLFKTQFNNISNQSYLFWISLTGSCLFSVFMNIFLFMSNNTLTPSHIALASGFSTMITFIIKSIESYSNDITYLLLCIVCYLFQNIGFLIYTEVIIILLVNCNEYTKESIERRSKSEYNYNMAEMQSIENQIANIGIIEVI